MYVLAIGPSIPSLGQAKAQTFTTLHSFNYLGGAEPGQWGLAVSSNTLYGTTDVGGGFGVGIVFAVNTDGTAFTNLFSFDSGSDGGGPSGVILSGSTLYGGTSGGAGSGGTLFALNTDGTGFTVLYSFSPPQPDFNGKFDNIDGYWPNSLVSSGTVLYGTARFGGNSGNGTVFKLNTDGTGFTTLYSFTASYTNTGGFFTNSDGIWPGGGLAGGGLVLSGNILYGTANGGGPSGSGTIFSLHTDGTGFQVVHTFDASTNGALSNIDGANPTGLIVSGDSLYGTTYSGGSSGNGAVFRLNTDGTGFTTLHNFTAYHTNKGGFFTNSDGVWPGASLVLSDNVLYGTATRGSPSGSGTIFSLHTDGTGFQTLYSFTAVPPCWLVPSPCTNSDGYEPQGLILSGNMLYGTASSAGRADDGTVFSLSLPTALPQLAISANQLSVVLTWPTNASGFTLQYSSHLGSSTNWTDSSGTPAIVADQFVLTNISSGAVQFYRLKK